MLIVVAMLLFNHGFSMGDYPSIILTGVGCTRLGARN